MLGEVQMFAPRFIRIELQPSMDGVHVEVWQTDDKRYLSRSDHAVVYPDLTVGEAIDVISATLDSLGLPDPF